MKGGGGWMVGGGGEQRDLGASQTLPTDVKQWRIQRRGLGGLVGPPSLFLDLTEAEKKIFF